MEENEINLLPPEREIAIKRELWRRLVVFYGKVLVALLALFAVQLLVARLALKIETEALTESDTVRRERQELNDLQHEAERLAAQLKSAQTFLLKNPSASDFLGAALKAVPREITLTRLQFLRKNATLTINGRAPGRAALLDFEQEVKKNPAVAKADIPLASLLKAKDFDFSMTIVFADR